MVKGRGNGSDLYYMSHDYIGSVVTIADYRRAIVQELDYDAWGRRRDPRTLAYNVWDVKDDHGFTGHEHLDIFDMVNMDGRMYDPVVGRFLSPDPLVQAPDFTQSLNRYAYCLNNPLSLVDPTGYSWLSRSWKSITAAVVGIAVSVVTLGAATSLGMAIAAGAAGGAASALAGSLLNGANIGQIAKATFMGGFWGAASGALNYWCGDKNAVLSILKHAASESCLEALQGGNILHGLFMGTVAGLSGLASNSSPKIGKVGKLVISSAISGTLDEIGGGKFANGAVTGAFAFLFNDYMHVRKKRFHQRKSMWTTFPFDEKVGGGNVRMFVDSYVTVCDYVQEKKMNLDIDVTSYSLCSVDVHGGFIASLGLDENEYEYFLHKPKGPYITPQYTNFTGCTSIRNINYKNVQNINVTIKGNWTYDSGAGHGAYTRPTLLGFLIPAYFKQKFTIK